MPLFGQLSNADEIPPDSAAVESQAEILKSEKIALAVIEKLHLTEDPDFVKPGRLADLFAKLVGSVPRPQSQSETTRRVAETFARRLDVKRVGLSYIIEVGFSASDPKRAAQIANAVADAYMADQLGGKSEGASRAG